MLFCVGDEILACALHYHHDGMAARFITWLFEDSQETAASVETKWDFRDKGKVPQCWLAMVAPAAPRGTRSLDRLR